jgi:hypothetical protein
MPAPGRAPAEDRWPTSPAGPSRPGSCEGAPDHRSTAPSVRSPASWSPERIAGWLKPTHPGRAELRVPHVTIHRTLSRRYAPPACHRLSIRACSSMPPPPRPRRPGRLRSEASDPHAGLESRGQQGPARLWLAEMSSPSRRHRHSTHVIRNLLTLPPPSSGRSDAGNRDLNSSDVAAGSVVVLLDDPDRLPPLPAAHLICQQTHGLPAQRRGSITSDRPAEARLGSRRQRETSAACDGVERVS